MIVVIFKISSLEIVPAIGFALIAFSCLYFFGMLVYAIYAECNNKPMPLDNSYLIGRINEKIWIGSLSIGLICMII